MTFKSLLFVAGATLISGCSLIEDRADRYMQEEKAGPLVVPEVVFQKAVKRPLSRT